MAHYDYFQSRTSQEIKNILNLNINSIVATSYEIIKNHPETILVNVASSVVFQASGFLLSDYYLSKVFVHTFTKALMYEYPNRKIKILYPSYFVTKLLKMQPLSIKKQKKQDKKMLTFSKKSIHKILERKKKHLVIFAKDRL